MKRRQFIKKLGAIAMLGAVGKLTGESQSYFKPNPDYIDAPYSCCIICFDEASDIDETVYQHIINPSKHPELIFKHTQPNESQKPTSPTSSL